MEQSTTTTPSEAEKKNEGEAPRSSPRASPAMMLKPSSSSSSLLALPENKRDSPTKASRLKHSASSGSLARRNSASPIPEGARRNNAPPENEAAATADAATILESLESTEKEIQQGTLQPSTSSGSLAAKIKGESLVTQDTTAAVQETVTETKSTSDEKPTPAEKQPPPASSPQKKAIKIPASKKDSPRTPEGEKRLPRVSDVVATETTEKDDDIQRATMERLERISTSPVSIDSAEAAQEWLTEPTSPQKKSTQKESTIRAPPQHPGIIPRDPSLQWHEAKATSSRVITAPAEQPSGLLPSPPSMRISQSQVPKDKEEEVVAVFNANTLEGKSMVRALAKSGSQVVAIVRVFTSRNTKSLLKLGKNVVVKVADSHDEAALAKAVEGAHRAFLVTTYWDRFDSALEEKQAFIVLNVCASQNVHHLVLSSFEDTKVLREKGLKSQIVPRKDGTITPTFEGMKALKEAAKKQNVQLTHMITSYLDQENSKKSLCLIVGENGNLIVNSHIPEES